MAVTRLVRPFVAAPEVHQNVSRGVELDDGHRRLVHDPQVVIFVEPDRVRVGQAVHATSDFTHEISLLVVFECFVVALPIDRAAGRLRTSPDVLGPDVPLEIDRHRQYLPRFLSGGIFKNGTDSNGRSGTSFCAMAGIVSRESKAIMQKCFMALQNIANSFSSPETRCLAD